MVVVGFTVSIIDGRYDTYQVYAEIASYYSGADVDIDEDECLTKINNIRMRRLSWMGRIEYPPIPDDILMKVVK